MTTPDKKLDCADVLDLLDDYRRGTLDPDLQQQVGDHLATCESCAAELAFRESLGAQLRSALPAAVPPNVLSPALRRTIALECDETQEAARHRSPMLPWLLTAAAVGIVAVALMQIRPDSNLQQMDKVAMSTRYEPAQAAAVRPISGLAEKVADEQDKSIQLNIPELVPAASPPPAMQPPQPYEGAAKSNIPAAAANRAEPRKSKSPSVLRYAGETQSQRQLASPQLQGHDTYFEQHTISSGDVYRTSDMASESKANAPNAPAQSRALAKSELYYGVNDAVTTGTTSSLQLQTTATLGFTTATTSSVGK